MIDSTPALRRSLACCRAFRVVEETAEWIVIDKPAPLQIHPSTPGGGFTLWDGLKDLLAFELATGGQISIITRLDRETSGLVLVGKTRTTARRLSRLMERRLVWKEYLAIVWGWPADDRFTIAAPLARQGEFGPSAIWLKRAVHAAGSPAVTQVVVEQRFRKKTTNGDRFSIVRATPVTGRTHQIRVHLAHSGHPIVGDKIYGPSEGHYLDFIESGWTPALEQELLLPRHALHASSLGFADEDRPRTFHAPLPPELASWISSAEPASICEGEPNP